MEKSAAAAELEASADPTLDERPSNRRAPILYAGAGFLVGALLIAILRATHPAAPAGPAVVPPPAAPSPPRPATAAAAPTPSRRGRLSVSTLPPGALVWVDGVARGPSPISVDAGAGVHHLTLVQPGARVLRKNVDTTAGVDVVETLAPGMRPPRGSAGIKVRCRTEGRYPVVVDGTDTGLLCPTERIDLVPGKHQIGLFDPATGETRTETHDIAESRNSTRIYFRD